MRAISEGDKRSGSNGDYVRIFGYDNIGFLLNEDVFDRRLELLSISGNSKAGKGFH